MRVCQFHHSRTADSLILPPTKPVFPVTLLALLLTGSFDTIPVMKCSPVTSWPTGLPIFLKVSARFLTYLLLSIFLLNSSARAQQVNPPFHTSGYQIVDSANRPIRLAGANWYGFYEEEFVPGGLDHAPLDAIVAQIHELGLNSVRLPWANETLERNPLVPEYAVKANPQFRGKHALDVMDAIVSA